MDQYGNKLLANSIKMANSTLRPIPWIPTEYTTKNIDRTYNLVWTHDTSGNYSWSKSDAIPSLPAGQIGFGNATSDGITSSEYFIWDNDTWTLSLGILGAKVIADGSNITIGNTSTAWIDIDTSMHYLRYNDGSYFRMDADNATFDLYCNTYGSNADFRNGTLLSFSNGVMTATRGYEIWDDNGSYNINGSPHTHSQYAADGVVGSVQLSNGSGAMSSVTGLTYTTAGALAVPANATGLAGTLSTSYANTYSPYADQYPLLTLTNAASQNACFVGTEYKGKNLSGTAQEAYFGAITQAGASVYDMKFVWTVKNGASTFLPAMEYSLTEGLIVTSNSADTVHAYFPDWNVGQKSGFCCELDSWEAGTSTARKTCYAEMYGEIVDNTYTSEDGAFVINAVTAGVQTEQARFSGGWLTIPNGGVFSTFAGAGVYSSDNGTTLYDSAHYLTNSVQGNGSYALTRYRARNATGTSCYGWFGVVSTVGSTGSPAFVWTSRTTGSIYKERMRLSEDGQLALGTNSPIADLHIDTQEGSISVNRNINSVTLCPYIELMKTRGTTAGAVTTVQNGDTLGAFYFTGADGYSRGVGGAQIRSTVDGAVGTGVVPASISFWTQPSSGGSVLERMRIAADGKVGIGNASPEYKLDVTGDIRANTGSIYVYNKQDAAVVIDNMSNIRYSRIFCGRNEGTYQNVSDGIGIVSCSMGQTSVSSIRYFGINENGAKFIGIYSGNFYTGTVGSYNYKIYTNNTERLSITGAGVVSFGGTSFPTATGSIGQVLQVNGSGTATWGDKTDATGTFTGTLTGVSGTVTCTIKYQRIGNIVTLTFPSVFGASNSVSFTITGLLAELRPSSGSRKCYLQVQDNGIEYFGNLHIEPTTTITFGIGNVSGIKIGFNPMGFTSSGSKGIAANQSVSYSL